MSVLFLLVLIASFLGVDLGQDDDLIDNGYCASRSNSHTTDWFEDWYAWERCLLGAAYEPLTQTEADALVHEVWHRYLPWTQAAIQFSYSHFSDASAVGRLAPPTLHVGARAVADICGPDLPRGCHASGTGDVDDVLDYTPGQIAVHELERYTLLHELGHAIESHQWWMWGDDVATRPRALENERTGGHTLTFRCLALDLYHNYGSVSDAAYSPLHQICELHSPTYPKPFGDPSTPSETTPAEPEAKTDCDAVTASVDAAAAEDDARMAAAFERYQTEHAAGDDYRKWILTNAWNELMDEYAQRQQERSALRMQILLACLGE